MSINVNLLLKKILAIFLTYVTIAISASILMWVLSDLILSNISSIPESIRRGYKNPYLSILGVELILFLFIVVIYFLLMFVIYRIAKKNIVKAIVGGGIGLLFICFAYMGTFGFPYNSPADLVQIGILSIAGAFIPSTFQKFSAYCQIL